MARSGTPTPAGAAAPGVLGTGLAHAWHPVGLASELRGGGRLQTRLLGQNWAVQRDATGALRGDPPAWGVEERHGLVWLAPAEPASGRLQLTEPGVPRGAATWLPPLRTGRPAAELLGTLRELVPPASTEFCPPFQLLVRAGEPGPGAVRELLLALQPEDDDSTRLYAGLLLTGPDGAPVPRDVMAAEVAAVRAELAEVLAGPVPPVLPNIVQPQPAARPAAQLAGA